MNSWNSAQKLLFFGLLISASSTFADEVRLSQPAFGGNGCSAGRASASLSPDGKSILFTLDKVVAEAGNGRDMDRKTCNFSIPIHIPEGISIAAPPFRFRGFNGLPSKGHSEFQVETFFAGQRGPVLKKTFSGPLAQEYSLDTSGEFIWSACGQDANLRFNSSLLVHTNENQAASMMTLDGISEVKIVSRSCHR